MRSLCLALPFLCLSIAQSLRAQGEPVRVLLEDLHRQARIQSRYAFAQGVMARVLSEEGAKVESSSQVFRSAQKLTLDALAQYDMVVMNGR